MESGNEVVVSNELFSYSTMLTFIKCEFELTNKRLRCVIPNLFLFFQTGKNEITYPLKQISGVSIHTRFSIKSFLGGFILFLMGISGLGESRTMGLAIIFIILGSYFIQNAFKTLIGVTNTGGKSVYYNIAQKDRKEAQEFINQINNQITRLD